MRFSVIYGRLGMLLILCMIVSLPQNQVLAEPPAEDPVIVNGLNTKKLGGLVDTLKEKPQGGRVTFFSKSRWQDGMRAFTSFTGYKLDGQMVHQNERKFVLLGDEATELSGTDAAPGAVEELMYALGTCIIAAGNANAALRGIELTRFDVELESDLDMHGLFALDPEVRPGILELRAKIIIAGDADDKSLKEIANLGYQFSPVSDSIQKGVKVIPTIEVSK